MKQKELTKTFMMIENYKTFSFHVLYDGLYNGSNN